MADYRFRNISERQGIQRLWESGNTAKEIADSMGLALSSVYTELKRGQDGTRLPDQRLKYSAELAQLRMQQSFERRGRKAARAPTR